MPKEPEESEKSLPRLLGRIAYGSAEKVTGATSEAGSLLSGVYGTIVTELLPDMEKIDKLVGVATISAYSLIAFGVSGALFFLLKLYENLDSGAPGGGSVGAWLLKLKGRNWKTSLPKVKLTVNKTILCNVMFWFLLNKATDVVHFFNIDFLKKLP